MWNFLPVLSHACTRTCIFSVPPFSTESPSAEAQGNSAIPLPTAIFSRPISFQFRSGWTLVYVVFARTCVRCEGGWKIELCRSLVPTHAHIRTHTHTHLRTARSSRQSRSRNRIKRNSFDVFHQFHSHRISQSCVTGRSIETPSWQPHLPFDSLCMFWTHGEILQHSIIGAHSRSRHSHRPTLCFG